MLSLVDKDTFKPNQLAKHIKLQRTKKPPPKLIESKIFETKGKRKSKKKNKK